MDQHKRWAEDHDVLVPRFRTCRPRVVTVVVKSLSSVESEVRLASGSANRKMPLAMEQVPTKREEQALKSMHANCTSRVTSSPLRIGNFNGKFILYKSEKILY